MPLGRCSWVLILGWSLATGAHGPGLAWGAWQEHRIRQGDGKGGWVTHRVDGMCGHIAAVVLPDGHVVSAYGHYLLGASVLIKWKPYAGPVQPPPAQN